MDKLKFVMESLGLCQHTWSHGQFVYKEKGGRMLLRECLECGLKSTTDDTSEIARVYSLNSLDDLMKLARKLDLGCITFTYEGDEEDENGTPILCWMGANGEDYIGKGYTEAEALLNALYKAQGGK